ncbi:MAG: hypothetical protein UV56_C0016G0008 [Candidatus Woesebacteria bacterium GW2011_GWC1_43_10b]|uniref:Uncharacterized protein n=4 Tax=Microgenomates group TaxID=1794810 RepID=A0A0G0M251_9BACT|nr:MAG: hypothetical protein UT23_C0004G0107 [Candidatus Woesebacteria bacterium GW2011_GWA1_39_12]KKR01068.1 MAG: hypothetical protein UT24_C0007G0030 [Candidatus Woesebacteria bacterium GW2011_GWB1_39_12]KKS80493.1 MAG: hypothetical protein UV56_C0016G0008 [Candidatus Woesebacteria bacterium GW2011_GWC1_43_10b]
MNNIKIYFIALLPLLLLLASIIFPQPVSAVLGVGIGSFYLGSSNKTEGSGRCDVMHFRPDGWQLWNTVTTLGPLETKGFGNIPELPLNHYNSQIVCTNGTTSIMGIWRNPTQTAIGAYGGDQGAINAAFIPGLVKNYYNQTSSVFVSAELWDLSLHISFYDINGTKVGSTYFTTVPFLGMAEIDLKDYPSLPDGRYSVGIGTDGLDQLFTATVVTRNVSGPDRVIAWRVDPLGGYKLYAPSVRKNYYGYNSTLVINNWTDSAGYVTVSLLPGPYLVSSGNLAGHATLALNSSNFNIPDGDYTAVVTSSGAMVVGMSSTFHSTNNSRGAYALASPTFTSKYRALPALWNYTPNNDPRISSVKCMNTSQTQGKIRLTIQGGAYAESGDLGVNQGQEFVLQNIPQFPLHTMFAGLAESMSGGTIACVATSNVSGSSNDRFFQYESNISNNDNNQNYSSKILTLYDDQ